MKNDRENWPVITYLSVFLIGVILFWAVGKNWLDLESKVVFLAGLLGVAVSVILFGAWTITQHSTHKDD